MSRSSPPRNDRFEDYVPVAERLEKFYEKFPDGRVITHLIEHNMETGFVLMRAEVYRSPDDAQPAATGHAFEVRVHGRDLIGSSIKGRSLTYCTDTMYCENAVALADGADVLIHEATFAEQDEHLAVQSMHSTTAMAARVASEARVRRLFLTHFSPRYNKESHITPDELLAQARAIFPRTEMARDLLAFDIPRRDESVER